MTTSIDQETLVKIQSAVRKMLNPAQQEHLWNLFYRSGASLVSAPAGAPNSTWDPNTNTISIAPIDFISDRRLTSVFVHEVGHPYSFQLFRQQLDLLYRHGSQSDLPTLKSQIAKAWAEMELRADLLNLHFDIDPIYVQGDALKSAADRLWRLSGGFLEDGMITNAMLDSISTGSWARFHSVAQRYIDRGLQRGLIPRAGEDYNSPQALNHLMQLLVNFDIYQSTDPFNQTRIPDWVKSAFTINRPSNTSGPSIQA